jgi:hypothetical protein
LNAPVVMRSPDIRVHPGQENSPGSKEIPID